MHALKALLGPRPPTVSVVNVRRTSQRLLTEYVLNMAVSCLARGDIAPLYEHYLDDPRLVDEDRDELARAYLLLQMAAVQAPDTAA